MKKLLPVFILAAFILLYSDSAFCRKIIINLPETVVVESNKKVLIFKNDGSSKIFLLNNNGQTIEKI